MTLRELYALWMFQNRLIVICRSAFLSLFGLFLAFVGTYDTYDLPFIWRTLYWIGFMNYGGLWMSLAAGLTFPRLIERRRPVWLAMAWLNGLSSIPIFLTVKAVSIELYIAQENDLALSWQTIREFYLREGNTIADLLLGYMEVLVICIAVSCFVYSLFYLWHKSQIKKTPDIAPTLPAGYKFLNRLPASQKTRLVCLAMEDHYVRAYTDTTDHLILLRLKDAISELADYSGQQVHRSWWVAYDAIRHSRKEGRRYILTLNNGMEVPVSQTHAPELKDLKFI
ncbi:LytTR family DNA-binding domain-containing protein [Paremcibacter congregatus]|uniref:HTH LytTR-type domain-containing protein n=1 Tax=Paremcibacter congregatus TaxID=2043170 RepID=A0A2G4YLZ8_9PROT|nr:LytTR family DNA-binding domain-containing protein [Paremcibacter congregatus]PHZ83354.1 hypothetical protein CRD36_17460 [Paremcibacter congregatus]QDE28174.1 LytTR family transcriptional regulator [Paremcibacter congregatus]